MKRADFVAAIKAKVGNTGYAYGCYVPMILTQALLDRKALQFPKVYTAAYKALTARNLGKPVADCAGLIKGTVWVADFGGVYQKASDLSADGLFSACVSRGIVDVSKPNCGIPEIPGLVLHKSGHIGVYIGDGQAVESRGVAWGVCVTNVKDRGWTGWGKCHIVDYVDDPLTVSLARVQELETALASEKQRSSDLGGQVVNLTKHISALNARIDELTPLADAGVVASGKLSAARSALEIFRNL